MKLLFLGDIVGKSGREAVYRHLPELRDRLQADCIVANGENAAHGFGLNPAIATELFAAGVDCITTGNHVWDKKEIMPVMQVDHRILRPLNYPPRAPGVGATLIETQAGRVLVMNAMGRLYMGDPLDDPFAAVDRVLDSHVLGRDADAILLDFHAEASSEKMVMGHHLDGRVSLVVGTHTHVPTADAQILPGGTAYQTDAGMCGDYDSVIGMKKASSVARQLTKMPGERFQPAEGEGTVCGIFIETGGDGLAVTIRPVRIGPKLTNCY